MLYELFTINDVERLPHPILKQYLKERFEEIGGIKAPRVDGYFVYVENFKILYQRNALRYVTLSSIAEGLFRNIEGVTIKQDIVEVSLLFNNEFLITLVFYGLDEESLSMILNGSRSQTNPHTNSGIPNLMLSPTFPEPHAPSYITPNYPVQKNCSQSSVGTSHEMSGAMMGMGMLLLRCLLKR